MESIFHRLIAAILLLVTLTLASEDNCMEPVTDPAAIFGQGDSVTPTLEAITVNDNQICNDKCCQSESCNIVLFTKNASQGVLPNCALYACHPTTTCNIKAQEGVLIFIDRTSTTQTPVTLPPANTTQAPITTPPANNTPEKTDGSDNGDSETIKNNTLTGNNNSPTSVDTGKEDDTNNNAKKVNDTAADSDQKKDIATPPAVVTTTTLAPTTAPVPTPTTLPPLKATPTPLELNLEELSQNETHTTDKPAEQVPENITTTSIPLPNVLPSPLTLSSVTPTPLQDRNSTSTPAATSRPMDTNTTFDGLGISSTPVAIATSNNTLTQIDAPIAVLYTSAGITSSTQITAGLQSSPSNVVLKTDKLSTTTPVASEKPKELNETPKSSPAVKPTPFLPSSVPAFHVAPSSSRERVASTSPPLEAGNGIHSSRVEKPVADIISVTTDNDAMSTTTSPNDAVSSSYVMDIQNITSDHSDAVIFGTSEAMTAILICALAFGCVFLLSVIGVLGKRIYDGYKKRHYSRLDYLINGMYN